ncbi:MAG: TA system VapC family ribonuclease toxin [Acidobacteriota bacterium]
MIAVDTNILVYARREETRYHLEARALLSRLAGGARPWSIPWPCVYEFIRVVTHPRVFAPPSEVDVVLEDVEQLACSPTLMLLGEGPTHLRHMARAVSGGRCSGNLAHDAHIAALVIEHGVRELLTTDRDFSRFPGIKVRDPFVEPLG